MDSSLAAPERTPDPAVLKELRRIPGVGEAISRDLWQLGIRSVEELRGRDPEELYQRLCRLQGETIDRCMLYVFRCAVYFASNETHDPDRLKWWNWKDARVEEHSSAGAAHGSTARPRSASGRKTHPSTAGSGRRGAPIPRPTRST